MRELAVALGLAVVFLALADLSLRNESALADLGQASLVVGF